MKFLSDIMTSPILSPALQMEEELVAELAQLGICYLSRQSIAPPTQTHAPAELIADLTRQPSSRVRAALIPLFLAHPQYAAHVRDAAKNIDSGQAITLKFFYTAAALLQRKYEDRLRQDDAPTLPDLFGTELGLSSTSIDEQLDELGKKHQAASGLRLNWAGSYENAGRHLLRQWELEGKWNASRPIS